MIDLTAALIGAAIGLVFFLVGYEWANAEDLK